MSASPEPVNGLERLRSGVGGSGARISFIDEFPFWFTDIEMGCVSIVCELDDLLHSAWELSPLGVIAACADSALGGVVGTVLDGEHLSISLQLRVDAARPIANDLRRFSCRATLLDVGPDVGLARADVLDDDGRIIAQALLRSAVTKVRPNTATADPVASRSATPYPSGGVPPADTPEADALSPEAQAQDGLTVAICRYLQASIASETDNALDVTVIPTAVMANSVSMVHGGAVALLTGLGGALTAQRRLVSRPTREIGLEIAYYAANRVETPTTLRGSVVHQTKRMATVEGEIRDPAGRITTSFRQLWQCAPRSPQA